jgi:putative transposase
MDFKFFNPHTPTNTSENRLPHWEQARTVYFVTFRLADALPAGLLRQWEIERAAWLHHHPEPWMPDTELEYHTRFSGAVERWLDEAHGECVLRQSAAARIVGDALNYFNNTRYEQLCWVVMPNHIHVVCMPKESWRLEDIVHAWKSFTAHALNKHLGRTGGIWQKDYFDRIIRDEDHLRKVIRYVRNNPVKARLKEGSYLCWESEFAKALL